MANGKDQHSRRRRNGRLFWIIGLTIGILGGAIAAIGIAEVAMVTSATDAVS